MGRGILRRETCDEEKEKRGGKGRAPKKGADRENVGGVMDTHHHRTTLVQYNLITGMAASTDPR